MGAGTGGFVGAGTGGLVAAGTEGFEGAGTGTAVTSASTRRPLVAAFAGTQVMVSDANSKKLKLETFIVMTFRKVTFKCLHLSFKIIHWHCVHLLTTITC